MENEDKRKQNSQERPLEEAGRPMDGEVGTREGENLEQAPTAASEATGADLGQKSKNGKKVALIVAIVILLVGIIGGVTWWVLAGSKKPDETVKVEKDEKEDDKGEEQGEDKEGAGTVTPEEEERRVKTVLGALRAEAERFLVEAGREDIILTDIHNVDIDPVGVAWGFAQPDGWGAAVPITKSLGYETVNVDLVLDHIDGLGIATEKALEKNGFRHVAYVGMPVTLYKNGEGVFCTIFGDEELLGPRCAYETWVDQTQKQWVNEMAAGYLEKLGHEVGMIEIDMSHLENSPVTPYQRIWVRIPNAAADFYRVNPEAEWKFFRPGQSGAYCSEYNTDELKDAFAGVKCYLDDSSTGSVVEAASGN